jgi:hypothetical protein
LIPLHEDQISSPDGGHSVKLNGVRHDQLWTIGETSIE